MGKKWLGMLLAMVLLATMLPVGSLAADKVEVVFWHNWSGNGLDALQQAADAFNASQAKIEVKLLYVATEGGDSVTSKMITAVAGGNPPEAILASRYGIAEYMDMVTLVDDLVARDNVDLSVFYPWALNEASYEGKLLGLPYDGTSRVLFYNKDHFAAAGLDPENPPKTIAELTAYAEKLTIRGADGRIEQYGLIPTLGQGWLYSWGWSFGGEFVDANGVVTPNDPKVVEALTWMCDTAKALGVEDVTSDTNSMGTAVNDPFISGKVSMVLHGNWLVGDITRYNPELNFGVCDIPGPEGVPPTTFVGGRAIVIPKGVTGEKLDAAWEWVKFLCMSEEAQSFKLISAEYPAVQAVAEKIYAGDPIMEVFLKTLPNGKNRPVVLAGNMMWDELAKAPAMVLSGQGTPQAILDAIAQKINDEIELKKVMMGL